MLKIGDFSMLSKISISMLRHYDELGLLTPAKTERANGYRYYTEEQLVTANRIQSLKAMGFSLTMIKKILEEYSDTESWKKYLEIQFAQKLDEIENLKQQALMISTALNNLDKESTFFTCDVAIKEIPKRKVVSYCREISSYEKEGELWQALHTRAKKANVYYANPSYDSAIVHEETEKGMFVEVQTAITQLQKDTDGLSFKEIEPVIVASLTFKGEYPQLYTINTGIAKWVNDNDYDFNGKPFNIYHISPKTEPKPENMITEVCFPIKKSNGNKRN